MKKILSLNIIIGLFLACQPPGNKHEAVESIINVSSGEWEFLTTETDDEIVTRGEAALAEVGGNLYLIGGRRNPPVNVYNVDSSTWTTTSTAPLELHHFQAAVFNNKIYCAGALTGNYPDEKPVPNIYIYDPGTDTWEKGPAIPEDRQRGSTGTVIVEDQLYMVAGIKNGHIGDHKKWLDVYNLTTNEWEILTDAPRPRDHFHAVEMNGKIFAIAGRLSKAPDEVFTYTIAEVDIYDIATDTWTTDSSKIPTLRAGNMALPIEGEIWIFGGESGTQQESHREVESFNPKSGIWTRQEEMIVGKHGTGAILYNNSIYIASGSIDAGENLVSSVEVFRMK